MLGITWPYAEKKWKWFIGSQEDFSLEVRIFHALSAIGICIAFLETVINLLNSLDSSALLTTGVCLTQIFFYYLSRFKHRSSLAITITAISIEAGDVLGYLYNSGVAGSTMLLFATSIFLIVLIVPKKQWLIWLIINLVIVSTLIITEYYHPGIVLYHYSSRDEMFIDLAASYVVMVLLLFACAVQMRKNYLSQVKLSDEKSIKLELLHAQKDKLFSIVSHDMNAPLALLKQYLDLLTEVDMSANERVLIEQDIIKSVNATQELLSNLLHWSKSQMNNVSVNIQPVNVNRELQLTIGLFRAIALKKGISLTADLRVNHMIKADVHMLELTIRNILNNAIKFTPEGGMVTIKSSIENNCCILSIADTGVGIPVEVQSKVFELGMQSTTGTMAEHGSGLGLMLIKEYTALQGGTVWFKSQVGAGTTFYISLPGYDA